MLTCEFLHHFKLYQWVFNRVEYLNKCSQIGPVQPVPNWNNHEIVQADNEVDTERSPSPVHRITSTSTALPFCPFSIQTISAVGQAHPAIPAY